MTDKIHKILNFWFGDLGHADLPTSDRTNLWFGENEKLKLSNINIPRPIISLILSIELIFTIT